MKDKRTVTALISKCSPNELTTTAFVLVLEHFKIKHSNDCISGIASGHAGYADAHGPGQIWVRRAEGELLIEREQK